MKFLVTGAAGFIGFHIAQRLCSEGHQVLGIDNLNDYYSVELKLARLETLQREMPSFEFLRLDITHREGLQAMFRQHQFERVIHLAAQAGVRYSLDNPHVYADSNLTGFVNVLEGCRQTGVQHLLYASSSSVYGNNAKVPFAIEDVVEQPISLYAATKRANELMAYTYAHLYRLPTTGLRFFTVYGPWGRPDMAPFKFTKAILEGQPIDIYNQGDMSRDFTYIDDVVEGIMRIQDCPPPYADESEQARQGAPARLFNIGLGSPVRLLDFVGCIESATGIEAIKQMKPMQPGDVSQTWADVSALAVRTGFRPATPLPEGVARFVAWYRSFYGA
ncbi:protein CapI [Pseudomonas alcaligenes]|uniref:Protein CapI n=1 Tax=Aquipseudomonas alcaligenes TaxID=43263 RepID=A0ABR7RZF4_AQUAC|nr:NAD-dependent epimerase [Pseudomonas alcaligenes]MBC9250721.1 protein CapI [Pseudomonas alcaligenes]